MPEVPLTLTQLNRQVAQALARPDLQQVWVVAELSDLRLSNGHCYMELVEKSEQTGGVLARLRAVIWASSFPRLNALFFEATGSRLATGLKLLLCGSISYHPAYGISFVISAIDPTYTMGEAERRRREILLRLQREGLLGLNRELDWTAVPQRIAVISAAGAAGYGDFINQLYTNPSRLRFSTELFPAIMQGERTVPTVIAALEAIAARIDDFDGVVIIRGGGASTDLQAFDDYDLAANVAQFPLPIIIGIGHERDTSVLDHVANMRVKTPTAAAEWLIARGEDALQLLRTTSRAILQAATDRIAGASTQLAYLESTLDVAPAAALQRAEMRLRNASATLLATSARRISPALERLSSMAQALATATQTTINRANDRLTAAHRLLQALSPQATLKRGYSITTYQGRAITNPADLPPRAQITTHLHHGSLTSTLDD